MIKTKETPMTTTIQIDLSSSLDLIEFLDFLNTYDKLIVYV